MRKRQLNKEKALFWRAKGLFSFINEKKQWHGGFYAFPTMKASSSFVARNAFNCYTDPLSKEELVKKAIHDLRKERDFARARFPFTRETLLYHCVLYAFRFESSIGDVVKKEAVISGKFEASRKFVSLFSFSPCKSVKDAICRLCRRLSTPTLREMINWSPVFSPLNYNADYYTSVSGCHAFFAL